MSRHSHFGETLIAIANKVWSYRNRLRGYGNSLLNAAAVAGAVARVISLADSSQKSRARSRIVLSMCLVGHNDDARRSEHAADAVADRDLGVSDFGGGGAAHLAHALLQRVHAVHAGMHVGKAAAIGVERVPRAAVGLQPTGFVPWAYGSSRGRRGQCCVAEARPRRPAQSLDPRGRI